VVANGVVYSPDYSLEGFGSPYQYDGPILDAEAGTALGTFGADRPPALTATTGFFMQQGTLHGIALGSNGVAPATGGILWSFAGDGKLSGTPIVINNYVIIASSSGNLYALAAATGQLLWTQNIGSVIPGGASPAISSLAAGDGLLVVPATSTVTAYAVSGNP
jgi:outer membrane protein assembly factor BamB